MSKYVNGGIVMSVGRDDYKKPDAAKGLLYTHREAVYAAEFSRLSGEPALTADELHLKMEALFDDWEA